MATLHRTGPNASVRNVCAPVKGISSCRHRSLCHRGHVRRKCRCFVALERAANDQWESSSPLDLLVCVSVRGVNMSRWRRVGHGERQRYHLPGEGVVVGVDQRDRHLVLAGRKPSDVDRVVVTCVSPPPGQVVDSDVQVPNARRYREGARPEHRCDVQVLHPVLGPEDALGQRLRQAGGRRSAWVRARSQSRRRVKRRGSPSRCGQRRGQRRSWRARCRPRRRQAS